MNFKHLGGSYSRRDFLAGTAALALTHSIGGFGQANKTLAYIGTYTGATGNNSNGEGIYVASITFLT